jgi:predicted nuclease of predicted toxin-antitoxin system
VNFLADESVDRPIVDSLRQRGHDVLYVAEMEPGISDDAVLDLANREGALLLTGDKDFGELVFRLGRFAPGVILLRLAGLSARSKGEVVAAAITQHIEELSRAFVVITPATVRIRRRTF